MEARWKKVLTDLWGNKMRTVLAVLSIAVGVFAVGVVVSSFVIVRQDMAADYSVANPHAARIFTDDFGPELVNQLAQIPGVTAVEGRTEISTNVASPDGKQHQVTITSIPSLDQIQVDKLIFEAGSRQLNEREIFLERQGAAGLGLQPGDTVEVEVQDGRLLNLKVAGTVHDVQANPFIFTGQTAGYVTPATMEWMGGSGQFRFAIYSKSGSQTDVTEVSALSDTLAETIRGSGREVYNININNPGQHPAQSIIDAVLALMGTLAVLSVFLSVFLVLNTLSALMAQQVRQIGVMKAVGATMGQMAALYLALVLAFGVLALVVAVPLAGLASMGLTRWLIGMLNATPSPYAIPPLSLGLQLVIGLVVPLIGAVIPVLNGARMTVRDAISSYGLNTGGRSLIDRALEALRGLPRPLMLSLRNTFRRKARLVLTLATLVLAGAIFVGVFNVRQSMYSEFDQTFGYFRADVNADFAMHYPLDDLSATANEVPGVSTVEGWETVLVRILHDDGAGSDMVLLYAPPAATSLVSPVVTTGRWLTPEDTNAIVVDNHFIQLRPDVGVGSQVQVRIGQQDYPFQVVGIFRLAGDPPNPFTYANREYITSLMGTTGQVNSLRVVTDTHDPDRQYQVMKDMQARFKADQVGVSLQIGSDSIQQKRTQTNLLVYLLLFMAVLIALVGGLGLTGTMSMNVLERTREIGVMRSIGADNGAIFQLVVVEGMLVGLISWALSILVAIPITHLLGSRLGTSLLTVPLVYEFSWLGVAIWLGVILALSVIACTLPARNAVRLTVRDVLAYE